MQLGKRVHSGNCVNAIVVRNQFTTSKMKFFNSIILLLFLFVCQPKIIAQELRVVSASDNSSLPYATITNLSRPSIVSCDSNGVAHLSVEIGDTLSVSYIGYKTSLFRFGGNKIQVIRLLTEQTLLPAVTVRTCKSSRQLVYKNFDPTRVRKGEEPEKSFGGVIWTKGTLNSAKVGVRLTPSEENATLKDFSFWLESQREAPKSAILNPLIISLYNVDDSTYMPGELIFNKPIIYFPKREGKQTIELDTLSIRIPPRGIYVSLQYVMHESYEWKQVFWQRDSLGAKVIDTIVYKYGGLIKGLRTKDFDFVWYNALKEKWFSIGGRPIPNDDFHSSIKCEATIKVCGDLNIATAAHNSGFASAGGDEKNFTDRNNYHQQFRQTKRR